MRKYLVLFTGSLLAIGLQGCAGEEPSLDEIKKKVPSKKLWVIQKQL